MNRKELYFDDLEVGQKFKTDTLTMSAGDIRRFAAEFDPQPFHLDEMAARSSLFGGLAASGWHTAALTMRLLLTSGPRLVGGIVGAGAEIAWRAPTRPGYVIHVESEIVELGPARSWPDRGIVVMRSKTINQRGEVLQTLNAKLVAMRRSARSAATTSKRIEST